MIVVTNLSAVEQSNIPDKERPHYGMAGESLLFPEVLWAED
jgi:hypothetical protein